MYTFVPILLEEIDLIINTKFLEPYSTAPGNVYFFVKIFTTYIVTKRDKQICFANLVDQGSRFLYNEFE